jgi:hypothetical protein
MTGVIRTDDGYGSRLANGQRSASFPASSNVSQEKWDSIFADEIEQTLNRIEAKFDDALKSVSNRG